MIVSRVNLAEASREELQSIIRKQSAKVKELSTAVEDLTHTASGKEKLEMQDRMMSLQQQVTLLKQELKACHEETASVEKEKGDVQAELRDVQSRLGDVETQLLAREVESDRCRKELKEVVETKLKRVSEELRHAEDSATFYASDVVRAIFESEGRLCSFCMKGAAKSRSAVQGNGAGQGTNLAVSSVGRQDGCPGSGRRDDDDAATASGGQDIQLMRLQVELTSLKRKYKQDRSDLEAEKEALAARLFAVERQRGGEGSTSNHAMPLCSDPTLLGHTMGNNSSLLQPGVGTTAAAAAAAVRYPDSVGDHHSEAAVSGTSTGLRSTGRRHTDGHDGTPVGGQRSATSSHNTNTSSRRGTRDRTSEILSHRERQLEKTVFGLESDLRRSREAEAKLQEQLDQVVRGRQELFASLQAESQAKADTIGRLTEELEALKARGPGSMVANSTQAIGAPTVDHGGRTRAAPGTEKDGLDVGEASTAGELGTQVQFHSESVTDPTSLGVGVGIDGNPDVITACASTQTTAEMDPAADVSEGVVAADVYQEAVDQRRNAEQQLQELRKESEERRGRLALVMKSVKELKEREEDARAAIEQAKAEAVEAVGERDAVIRELMSVAREGRASTDAVDSTADDELALEALLDDKLSTLVERLCDDG